MVVLTFHPTTRLAALVESFGGKSRDEAVADAGTALESMRGESDAVIDESISMLEELVRKAALEGKKFSALEIKSSISRAHSNIKTLISRLAVYVTSQTG